MDYKDEESTDQTEVESDDDQTIEESEDQTDSLEEDGSDVDESEDETDEESDDEVIEIDAARKMKSSELAKSYKELETQWKKTQAELSEFKKAAQAPALTPQRSTEEMEALKTLTGLGVATKDDVDTAVRRMFAQYQMQNEVQTVQKATGLDEDMLYAARALSLRKNISLTEAAELLGGKKPIRKKSVSAKGGTKSGVKTGGDQITPDYINSLDMNDPKDVKKFEKIRAKWEKGEL